MSELYQNVVLEHNRSPRNYRRLADATGSAEGNNPLCGDQVTVFAKVENGVVADVSFQGSGCAISRASASLMTQAVKGRPVEEARRLFEGFHRLLTGVPAPEASASGSGPESGPGPGDADGADTARDSAAAPAQHSEADLGKLAVLGGVRAFPMRVKCATLAWHALSAALAGGASGERE